jgi:hypothetical protein|tara:strand:+ start:32 stop:475 length:444 start_codon:yes stop_codon:yes gene_type:complete
MKVYKNILLEKERLEILNFVKTTVKDLGPDFPGLQSSPDLHQYKELKILIDKIKDIIDGYSIQKCWANFSNGDYICWHNHGYCDKSMVYYLKNKSNIGTMFKKEGYSIEVSEGLQNSLLVFNSDLTHSVPCHLSEERYSIAFDLFKK